MTLANDDKFRAQFRRANFHGVGGLLSTRSGLMSEAEAIQQEQDDVDTIIHKASESEECDLSFCRLTSLPPAVLDLTNLHKLNLESNQLAHLPESFGGLCYLKELCLRRNRLHSLPETMCMMDALEVLDVSNNLIARIPDEFSDMTEMRRLVADFNYLECVPRCVTSGMPKLEQLYLIENPGIVSVPETAEEWGVQYTAIANGYKSKLYLEIDNAPELMSSMDRMQAQVPSEFTSRLELKYNKIWPDMVVDHIALGSLRTVQNMSAVTQLGVTHVLTCGRNLKTPKFPPPIQQMVLDVDDDDDQDMNQYFLRAIEFMQECVELRGLCIVHCFAGVSRSATVVVAYLMKSRSLTFNAALEFVQQHRPAANPNPNFRRQLMEFEKVCGSI